jgi:hypothetical protein
MAVLLFCKCGSDKVDVSRWNGERALLRCYTCGHHSWLDGFTVGELDLIKHLTGALVDQVRKHRKRTPVQQQTIDRARNLKS